MSHFNIPASKSGLVIDDKGDKTGKRDEYHDHDKSEHTHGIGETTETRCCKVGLFCLCVFFGCS